MLRRCLGLVAGSWNNSAGLAAVSANASFTARLQRLLTAPRRVCQGRRSNMLC